MKTTKGWAVQITCKDGTTFLCANEIGDVTPIWALGKLKAANQHRDKLRSHNFDARVVKITYAITRTG